MSGSSHDDHGDHGAGDHDDHAGGHGADPNADVVRGTPPTPAWLLTAALIGLVTVVASIVLAVALNDAISSKAPSTHQVEGDAEPGAEAEAEH